MSVTNRRIVESTGNADFYPTPAWATRVLMEHEKFEGSVWEPCCGNGAMAEVIREYMQPGEPLIATDLFDRGYGNNLFDGPVDFLDSDHLDIRVDNIITNPPFNLAEEMIHKSLEVASGKVAFLLRLAFLESVGRYKSLYSITPPARVWVFSERITFYPEGKQTGGSGTTAYAWFVWDKNVDMTKLGVFPQLRWFPPGYKK